MLSEIILTVERLVRDVAEVKKEDKVLVIADAGKLTIGEAFNLASRGLGAETVFAITPITKEHGSEISTMIAAAMKAADVVLVATTHAITHTRARREASAAGARVYITRGITEDMLIRGAVTVDIKDLRNTTAKAASALNDADEARIQSPAGTDVTLKLTSRKAFSFDCVYRKEVGFTGFITGEAAISPVEGTTNGTIVIDHLMDGVGRLKQPLVFTVKDGKVASVDGAIEEANVLEGHFERNENNRNIAELAIGTNPNARLIGNMAEDKILAGVVHFGIGDNMALGGIVKADIHLDGVVLKPTVILDNKKVLIKNGKLMV